MADAGRGRVGVAHKAVAPHMADAAHMADELPNLNGGGCHRNVAGGADDDDGVKVATARKDWVGPSPDYGAGGDDVPCFDCTVPLRYQLE
mmetsp:Transcript_44426/g.68008  ORF Transcript_44426/g.68008 Transcript_44426/m.68008 type:complete len:90 (+) Transcript_44426:308-577(+)